MREASDGMSVICCGVREARQIVTVFVSGPRPGPRGAQS